MHTVRLGRTGLQVTPVAYGTWQYSGEWGQVEERQAIDGIRHARELGITFFDTALGYGFGTSERLLGRALEGERDQVVIATKGGLRQMEDGVTRRDSSPSWIREGLEISLTALGTDHVDLYQVHWPDPRVPIEETAAAVWNLVAEGLVRHVGVSNYDVEQMRAFSTERQVETLQPPYHLFNREIEADVLPYAAEHDMGVLSYGPLAHGLLGGRFDEHTTFPADDWRSSSPAFGGDPFTRNLEAVAELGRMAEERDATVAQLAMAWVLAQPAVQVTIVGARRPAHLDESVRALDIRLDAGDLARIDEIMTGTSTVRSLTPGPR